MPKTQARRKQSSFTSITAWRKFAVHRLVWGGAAAIIALGMVAYFSTGSPGRMGGAVEAERASASIATVNGEPITRDEFNRAWEQQRRMARGSGSAEMQGQLLQGLVDTALLRNIAKKRGITVSDADIEKQINDLREKMGEKGKPADEDSMLQMLGVASMGALRELLRREMLPRALQESLAADVKVTQDDLLKSYDEVKAQHILIATTGGPRTVPGALPDAQAKRRAEQVLEKVRAGGNFAALANEYTMDPGNKMDPQTSKPSAPRGGDLGWAPYDKYDPAFAQAARALKKGETSGVVKSAYGYHIIQVEDARRNLPQDFAKREGELLQNMRLERTKKPFMEMLENARKTAKVEWKDPAYKWKYDLVKMSGGMMMFSTGGPQPEKDAFLKELRAYRKDNPDDAEAAMVLGQQLYMQYLMSNLPTPPGQKTAPGKPATGRDALRKEVIDAYAAALKQTEDQSVRFMLAQLYEEDKQPDKALEQYQKLAQILSWDDSPQNKSAHEQLAKAFKKLGKADLAAEQMQVAAKLDAQQKKEAAERAAEDARVRAAQKAGDEKQKTANPPTAQDEKKNE